MKPSPSPLLHLFAVVISLALVGVIAATAGSLAGYEIVGPAEPFDYPWRLVSPDGWSRASAWVGYALHNLSAWFLIAAARRTKGYSAKMRWFNWAMLAVHLAGFGLHWLQCQLWYDGLAQDVPEVSALGSVALMLIVVILLETPRRGFVLGHKLRFDKRFIALCREYHGYLFSWALIYTFWYHPMVDTPGHLVGFFYMLVLLSQSVLLMHRSHLNRRWTFALEFLVLPHGVVVAMTQSETLWTMFAGGFGMVFVLTQAYGLGLTSNARRVVQAIALSLLFGMYIASERLGSFHEMVRIPLINYGVALGLFALWWLV
ncbi:MAG: hypothetical protein ACPG4T_18150, partial [Nannocystaceae bacterium]